MKSGNFYAADLGNTRIKIAQVNDDLVITETKSIPNYEFLQNPKIDIEFSNIIAFASVNIKISDALRENNKEMQIFEIGKEIPIPILNKTDKPEQTGIDRLINCWYAYDFYRKPVIVIDAGTAITIDYCNEKGEFEGGIIMAGYDLQLRALHTFTSALPRVEYNKNPEIKAVGKSTEKAMLASVKFGIPGQIKACVYAILEKTDKKAQIFLTGGSSKTLENDLAQVFPRKNIFTNPNLSISAIQKIANKYFCRNV